MQDYTRRLTFLAGIWPKEHMRLLAPRAALLCRGAAFQKVVRLEPAKLKTNSDSGIKLLVQTLGGTWGKTTLEDKYEKFERVIYNVSQKGDESNESYMARHDIMFEDMLSQGATLADMRAYLLLRNSALSAEDKKRVIVEAAGDLTYDAVTKAIRMLGAKFFMEVQGQTKNLRTKAYDINVLADQDEEEANFGDHSGGHREPPELSEQLVDALLSEGDEDALVVHQFEEALIDAVQNDEEAAACMSSYMWRHAVA